MGRRTSWWMSCRTQSGRPEAEGGELGDQVPSWSLAGSGTRSEAQMEGVLGSQRPARRAPTFAAATSQLSRRPAPRVARQRCAPAGFRRASSVVSTPPCSVANNAPPMPSLSGLPLAEMRVLSALQWDPACYRDRPFSLPRPTNVVGSCSLFIMAHSACVSDVSLVVAYLAREQGHCWPLIPYLPVLVPCAPIGCFLKTGSYGKRSV